MYWSQAFDRLALVGTDFSKFHIRFVNDDEFERMLSMFDSNFGSWQNLCITGYFGEGITKNLIYLAKQLKKNVRLITRPLNPSNRQDRKNITALKKMKKAGIEIRVNERIHARMTINFSNETTGNLLLGSFDYNREGLSGENRNAGIFTRHPDLIKDAIEYFEGIWNNNIETIPFE